MTLRKLDQISDESSDIESNEKSHKKIKKVLDEDSNEDSDSNYGGEEEDGTWVVEKIIDHKVDSRGRRKFLLKWKGFPNDENTWENEEDLSCPELLSEYLKKAKIYEKENMGKGHLIEKPTQITKCSINKNKQLIYTAVYKSGKTKDMTSKDLFKLSPEIQIKFLEEIADFPEQSS